MNPLCGVPICITGGAGFIGSHLADALVGVGAKVTSGTPTFNIEYSLDDPNAAGYTVAGATWYVATGFSALTASTGGAIIIPCRAICINITSGTGAVTASIVQAGPV
jgi:hypothetical protein